MPDPRAMSITAHLMELAALVPPIDEDEEGPFARGDDGLEDVAHDASSVVSDASFCRISSGAPERMSCVAVFTPS